MRTGVAPLSPHLPGPWRAYAGMLLRPRRGVSEERQMPVIGRSTGPVKLQAPWLAAYRELIGLPDEPAVLPPLALQLAAAALHLDIMADRHFPFRAMGLVHLSQRVDQIAAVMPGAVLKLEAFTGRTRPVRLGTRFDLITEARREGRLVWRSVVGVLARHGERSEEAANDREERSLYRLGRGPDPMLGLPARPPAADTSSAPMPLSTFSIMDDGSSLQPLGWQRLETIDVPEDLGRRYASVAGDWNPIHQRAWLARRFGFERAVVHGTWTLARGLVAAGWPLNEAYSLHAQFRKPVLLPSSVATWIQTGSALQWLRVTDVTGDIEHVVARLEPAVAPLRG